MNEDKSVKPESNNEIEQKFNPADKFDPTKVNSTAAANVNNAEPVGEIVCRKHTAGESVRDVIHAECDDS
mgnify:CR=1 FL=1